MPQVDPVILELRAELRDYNSKVEQARRKTETSLGEMERRSTQFATGFDRSFKLAAGAALSYLGAIGTIGAAREFLRIADSAKQIEAQLRLATRETGNFAQAQADVRRIAAETRVGLEEAATLYSTFQRNANQLGISQEQAARATETVTKAFQISGASAQEAAGGLRQFLQGLQSGALRGEELNSVLENAPRLAKLLADSLGVTVGQLREMGAEGSLAADKLINALTNQKFTDGIDAEFRELPVTFEQAMQQVENAATITFSAFDRGGGFSQMLANFVSDGADGFADLEQSALDTGIEIRATFEGLSNAFDPLLDAARSVFGQIEGDAKTLSDRIRPLFVDIDRATNFLADISGKDGLFKKTRTNLTERFDAGYGRSSVDRRREIIAQNVSALVQKYDILGNPVGGSGPVGRVGGGGGGGRRTGGGSRGPSAETLARRAEQERLSAIREEASKQRELASLNDDLLAARAALATASEDILRFTLDQIESEKAQKIAALQTDVDLGKLSQDEFAARRAIIEEIAAAKVSREQIAAADQEAINLARQESNARRDQLLTLETEADLISNREDRLAAERRILDLVYKEEEAALRSAAAAGEIADLDEALANLKRRRAAEGERLSREFESPLQRYSRSLGEQDLGDEAEQLVVDEIEHVRRGMRDAISSAIGTDDPLITGLIDLLLQDLIFKPLANSLANADGGGGGFIQGIGSFIGSLFGGGRASGGRVNAGTMYRVNEGSSPGRVEGFVPDVAGSIVPLGRMNLARSTGADGGVVKLVIEEGPQFASRVRAEATGVAIEVQRAAAPQVIDAAANETARRFNRPRL